MIKYSHPPPPHHRPYFLVHNRMYRRCCLVSTQDGAAHWYFLVYDEEKLCWRVKLCADCENCIISLPPLSPTHKYIWTLTLFENVICFSSPFSTGLLSCTSHAESHALAHPLSHTHTLTHTHTKSVSLQQLLGLHLISWGIDFLPGITPCSSLVIMPTLPRTERRTANTASGLEIVSVAHKQEQIDILYTDENIVVAYYMEAFLYDQLFLSRLSLYIGNDQLIGYRGRDVWEFKSIFSVWNTVQTTLTVKASVHSVIFGLVRGNLWVKDDEGLGYQPRMVGKVTHVWKSVHNQRKIHTVPETDDQILQVKSTAASTVLTLTKWYTDIY